VVKLFPHFEDYLRLGCSPFLFLSFPLLWSCEAELPLLVLEMTSNIQGFIRALSSRNRNAWELFSPDHQTQTLLLDNFMPLFFPFLPLPVLKPDAVSPLPPPPLSCTYPQVLLLAEALPWSLSLPLFLIQTKWKAIGKTPSLSPFFFPSKLFLVETGIGFILEWLRGTLIFSSPLFSFSSSFV